MAETTVRYLGLDLSGPLIVGSSSLTSTVAAVRRAAEAGAGAVVLKSLFEEQIEHDQQVGSDRVDYSIHPEAEEYLQQMGRLLGPKRYLDLIAETKAAIAAPIIASINCVSARWWGDYGRQIESAGADALELNIALMPRQNEPSATVEQRYVDIVQQVHEQVKLPIAVKIGPFFTSLPDMVGRLAAAGASSVVLFNRFYQFDIDTDTPELAAGYQFSAPQELHTALRWVSILYGSAACDLVGATAIHTGDDVVKHLLAGATAVQVCSTVYQNGYDRISEMNRDLVAWMERHGHASIDAFRGVLSARRSTHPERHERLQYIKALTGLT